FATATIALRKARPRGYRLGDYQTWWRSGRDSNSRTGYARYGISSAAPSTRLGDRSAASRFYPPSLRPERRLLPDGRPSRLSAALITERWVSAWGKLPSSSPVSGSNSSAKSPRSFADSVTRLKRPPASARRLIL